MSYFSSKSTWLSLVDTTYPESFKNSDSTLDGKTLRFTDFSPVLPQESQSQHSSSREPVSQDSLTQEDLDYLKITRDLRHRLFFQFKEWEFGPALLEDHIRLARSENNAEEALFHYCHARHVAVTLVKHFAQPTYIMTWLETNKIIAEIHNLLGNFESCAVYAKEGLSTIKKNKFSADLDMEITRYTVQFFNLLGRK